QDSLFRARAGRRGAGPRRAAPVFGLGLSVLPSGILGLPLAWPGPFLAPSGFFPALPAAFGFFALAPFTVFSWLRLGFFGFFGFFFTGASGEGDAGTTCSGSKPLMSSRVSRLRINRSIARNSPTSSALTKEIARPLEPARPVRPIRCT